MLLRVYVYEVRTCKWGLGVRSNVVVSSGSRSRNASVYEAPRLVCFYVGKRTL